MTLENQPLTRSASEFAAPPRIRFTQSECCALEIIQTVQPGEKVPIDMIRKAVGSGEPGEDGQVSSPQQVGIIFANLNSKLENEGWVFKPYYKKQDGKKHQVVGGYSAKWSGDGDQTMAPQRLAGLIGANRLWHERIQQPQVTLFSLDSEGIQVTAGQEKKKTRPVTEILTGNLDDHTELLASQMVLSYLARGCLPELRTDLIEIFKTCLPERENSSPVFENLKVEEKQGLTRYLVGSVIKGIIDNWEEDPRMNLLGYPERRRDINQLCKEIRPKATLPAVIRVICSHFSVTSYYDTTVSAVEERRLFSWAVSHRGGY